MSRNVLNSWDVERFIAQVRGTTENPTIGRWLDRVARRWIIKDFPAAGRVVRLRRPAGEGGSFVDVEWPTDAAEACNPCFETTYESPHPDWLEAALPNGVYWIDMEGRLAQELAVELSGVLTYFKSLDADKLGRIERVALPDAVAQARRFSADARRYTDQTLVSFPDGFRIALLETPESLAQEGARMNHCVASYADYLGKGIDILSLRDPQDRPHVTMEVEEGKWLDQVKGKANGPVADSYRPMIESLIVQLGLSIRGDQELVGITSRSFRADDPESWRHQPRLAQEIRREICGLSCNSLDSDVFYGDLRASLKDLDNKTWSWLIELFRGPNGAFAWPEPSSSFEIGAEWFFVAAIRFPGSLFWLLGDDARSRALEQQILEDLENLILCFCREDDRTLLCHRGHLQHVQRDIGHLRRTHVQRVRRNYERTCRRLGRRTVKKIHSKQTLALWSKNAQKFEKRLRDEKGTYL